MKNERLSIVSEWINDEAMIRWIDMIKCHVDVYSICEYML